MGRSLFAGLAMLAWLPWPAMAQPAVGSAGVELPGSSGGFTQETCVQVEIGGHTSSRFDCLNRQLQRETEQTRPVLNVAPLSASSPGVQVGTFDETAMSEQYGPNWGKSVVPYRPPPPTYGTGLRP